MSEQSDRELLELAAKAAGVEGSYVERLTASGIAVAQMSAPVWNPLNDDGDALRLAVKLQMQVTVYTVCTDASAYGKDTLREMGDSHYDMLAATRRAIVRAAAAVGRPA